MNNYLDTTIDVYSKAAKTPDIGLSCTTTPIWQLSELVIPKIIQEMNYGCGSTVHPSDLVNQPKILYVGVGGGMEVFQFAYFSRQKAGVLGVDVVDEVLSARMLLIKTKLALAAVFLTVVFSLFPAELKAQSTVQKFEIIVAGFNIGQVTAEEILKGETTEYHVNSKASFWFFGKIELGFIIRNVYQKEHLINSKANSNTNRGDFQSTIIWKGDHYVVNSATYKFENNTPIPNPIYHSSGKFYFHEPRDGDRMVSETYGLVSRVTKKSEGVYEVVIDGNRNQYHYKNGKLDKIVVQNPIKNFVVQRVK